VHFNYRRNRPGPARFDLSQHHVRPHRNSAVSAAGLAIGVAPYPQIRRRSAHFMSSFGGRPALVCCVDRHLVPDDESFRNIRYTALGRAGSEPERRARRPFDRRRVTASASRSRSEARPHRDAIAGTGAACGGMPSRMRASFHTARLTHSAPMKRQGRSPRVTINQ